MIRASITPGMARTRDRKSTRLNSSHLGISYAVFCLKKQPEQPSIFSLTPRTWLLALHHSSLFVRSRRVGVRCSCRSSPWGEVPLQGADGILGGHGTPNSPLFSPGDLRNR